MDQPYQKQARTLDYLSLAPDYAQKKDSANKKKNIEAQIEIKKKDNLTQCNGWRDLQTSFSKALHPVSRKTPPSFIISRSLDNKVSSLSCAASLISLTKSVIADVKSISMFTERAPPSLRLTAGIFLTSNHAWLIILLDRITPSGCLKFQLVQLGTGVS